MFQPRIPVRIIQDRLPVLSKGARTARVIHYGILNASMRGIVGRGLVHLTRCKLGT